MVGVRAETWIPANNSVPFPFLTHAHGDQVFKRI